MKTRIIHTRFWNDNFVETLSHKEKLFFLYLITNEKVNLIGIYELSDKHIKSDLELTQQELNYFKQKLQDNNKILFSNGWVKIVKHDKYNSYNGSKVVTAKEREYSEVPCNFNECVLNKNTSMDTSMHTAIIQKPKTISNKYKEIESLREEEIKKISEKYQVPISFVMSKIDDLINWHEKKPNKNYYSNYYRALCDWVKRDSLSIKQKTHERTSKISVIKFDE